MLYRKRDQLSLVNGLLYKISTTPDKQVSKQLVVNKSCLPELLRYYHDNQAHLGEDRTAHILVDRFYWPCISSDVKSALKNCKTCLARKTLPSRNKTEMNHRAQAKYPMDIVAMDHLVIDGREGKTLKVLTIAGVALPTRPRRVKPNSGELKLYVISPGWRVELLLSFQFSIRY